jgi:hypothetical protein
MNTIGPLGHYISQQSLRKIWQLRRFCWFNKIVRNVTVRGSTLHCIFYRGVQGSLMLTSSIVSAILLCLGSYGWRWWIGHSFKGGFCYCIRIQVVLLWGCLGFFRWVHCHSVEYVITTLPLCSEDLPYTLNQHSRLLQWIQPLSLLLILILSWRRST